VGLHVPTARLGIGHTVPLTQGAHTLFQSRAVSICRGSGEHLHRAGLGASFRMAKCESILTYVPNAELGSIDRRDPHPKQSAGESSPASGAVH
jgi:hypothetical protein